MKVIPWYRVLKAAGGSNAAARIHQITFWWSAFGASNLLIFNGLESIYRQATPRGCPVFRIIVGPGDQTCVASAGGWPARARVGGGTQHGAGSALCRAGTSALCRTG